MADHVIHISEAEAASDFAGLLARVRAGAEVIIENGKLPVAVIHAPVPPRRTISECIALLPEDSARKHERRDPWGRAFQKFALYIQNIKLVWGKVDMGGDFILTIMSLT